MRVATEKENTAVHLCVDQLYEVMIGYRPNVAYGALLFLVTQIEQQYGFKKEEVKFEFIKDEMQ